MSSQPSTDLRRAVLDAAIALIDEKGLAAFSMREVARRAGVSHQAPYHHFDDRGAIIAALCVQGFVELAAALRRALDKAEPTDWPTAVGTAYVRFALRYPTHFRLMFRPELAGYKTASAVEAGKAAYEALREVAKQSAGPGASDADIDVHSTFHWSLAHGLATLLLDSRHGQALGESHVKRVAKVMRLHGAMVEALLAQ